MASKRIFRACKLQGLSLHADALARLTEELTKYVLSSLMLSLYCCSQLYMMGQLS